VTEPRAVAEKLATYLELPVEPLKASLASAFDRSVGRWQRDLSQEQLADVKAEAGELLRDLGYL
jgi:hypothetical protein